MSPARISVERLAGDASGIDTAAAWIHAEWSAFSGRTLEETRARFANEVPEAGLPITLAAYVDGEIAGIASLRARDSADWDAAAQPWLCNVFVAPGWRRRGVAEALCLACEATAAQLGYPSTHLASIAPEGSLYERIGYRIYAWRTRHGERFALMRKSTGETGKTQ